MRGDLAWGQFDKRYPNSLTRSQVTKVKKQYRKHLKETKELRKTTEHILLRPIPLVSFYNKELEQTRKRFLENYNPNSGSSLSRKQVHLVDTSGGKQNEYFWISPFFFQFPSFRKVLWCFYAHVGISITHKSREMVVWMSKNVTKGVVCVAWHGVGVGSWLKFLAELLKNLWQVLAGKWKIEYVRQRNIKNRIYP